MIIVPRNTVVEADAPDVKLGMEGWFILEAKRAGRTVRRREFPTHNLITNIGLDRIGSLSAALTYRYCHVGTGTTSPSPTDSQLAVFLANLMSGNPSTERGNSGAPDYFSWRRFTWITAVGALGNNILTEVGISGQNSNGLLFSRDLIKDSAGNPSTFPISSDEQLAVTYELRLYPPQGDVEEQVQIGPDTYDTITRAANAGSTQWGVVSLGGTVNFDRMGATGAHSVYEGDIRDFLNVPAGTAYGTSGGDVTATPYIDGTHYRDISARYGTSVGAVNVRSALFSTECCRFQVQYDPIIPKQANQSLILRQRVSWGRR